MTQNHNVFVKKIKTEIILGNVSFWLNAFGHLITLSVLKSASNCEISKPSLRANSGLITVHELVMHEAPLWQSAL